MPWSQQGTTAPWIWWFLCKSRIQHGKEARTHKSTRGMSLMSCAHVCTLHSSAPNSPGACIIVPLMPLQGGLSKASSIINMPFTSINESWADHYLKIDLQIPPLTSLSMSETSIDIQRASCVITDWTNTSTIQQPFTLNHHRGSQTALGSNLHCESSPELQCSPIGLAQMNCWCGSSATLPASGYNWNW